jgi:methylenetetrahydrofolate reductase (NADPH)
MPMLSKSQLENMCFMCGSSLPSELIKIVHRYEESPEDLRKASLDYAVNQMDDLVKHGVDGVHVYSMNHAEIAQAAFAKIRGEQSC